LVEDQQHLTAEQEHLITTFHELPKPCPFPVTVAACAYRNGAADCAAIAACADAVSASKVASASLNAVRVTTAPGALKYDGEKPMLHLLTQGCPKAVLGVGAVLTYGMRKYGAAHGWKYLEDAKNRYESALLRHVLAKANGEVNDPESGLPHSWHIACNALFLAELEAQ
jgi:Domain of unknown function (DUF5664)